MKTQGMSSRSWKEGPACPELQKTYIGIDKMQIARKHGCESQAASRGVLFKPKATLTARWPQPLATSRGGQLYLI